MSLPPEAFNAFVQGLPAAGTITGDEDVPLVQGGASKRSTAGALGGARGANQQLQYNDSNVLAGADFFYFDPTTLVMTVGSSTNTSPTLVLDPNVVGIGNLPGPGFNLLSYPLFDGSDGLSATIINLSNGTASAGAGENYGGALGILLGNVVSGAGVSIGGGFQLSGGQAFGAVGGLNGSFTLLVPTAVPASTPVGFTLTDGGNGYPQDGTFTDLLGTFAITASGDSGGFAITQLVIAGGVVTALNGIYDCYGTPASPGDVYTLSLTTGPAYPYADTSGTPATVTVSAVSGTGVQGAIDITVNDASTLQLDSTQAKLSNLGPSSSLQLDAGGNINLSFGGSGALGLQGSYGTAGQSIISQGAGAPPLWGEGSIATPTEITNGGGSVVIDGSGNITETAASAATWTAVSNGSSITLDGSGNFGLASVSGAVLNIAASGQVQLQGLTGQLLQIVAANSSELQFDETGNVSLLAGGTSPGSVHLGDSQNSSLSLDGAGNVGLQANTGNLSLYAELGQFSAFGAASSVINIDGAGDLTLQAGSSAFVEFVTSGGSLILGASGAAAFSAGLGIYGATGPAQLAGWGTPTGGAPQADYSATTATPLETNAAVAQIIASLEAFGLYAA